MARKSKLKFWNGRTDMRGFHGYIAAHSQRDAVAIGQEALGNNFSIGELRNYWSPGWGNMMQTIHPTKPGVWIVEEYGGDSPIWQFIGRSRK